MQVVLVGVGITMLAAVLGGMTGFGYSLIATPLLLMLGVPPATAVAVNLAIALATRVAVVARLWSVVQWRRAAPLALASLPGLVVGALLGGAVDRTAISVATGTLALVAAPLMILKRVRNGRRPVRHYALAGFAGGALGTTTSLNGVPVALVLSDDTGEQRSVIADLAVYFVLSNIAGLVVLGIRDGVVAEQLTLLAWWLPGALLANWVGTSWGSRIRPKLFRAVTCVLVMAAGVATLLTA